MFGTKIGTFTFSALLAISAAACGDPQDAQEDEITEVQSALARPSGISLWPNGIVPICWDSSAANHARFAELSARFLEVLNDHFPRAANIQFEDAGRCPANPTGVVKVTETNNGGANVWPIGYRSNAATPVNFDFDSAWFSGPQAQYQQVIMHEFAHVLGFEHEFMRPDWTNACDSGGNLAAGWDSHGTSPDFNSITASTYCTTRTILSAADITGLQNAYGTPGLQRINAAATDGGLDVMWHWWSGSTWAWSELFPDLDNISTRLSLASVRSGAAEQIRAFSLVGSNMNQDFWNGTTWSHQRFTDKNVDLAPATVAYRDYGTGVNGSYAASKTKWFAFSRDSTANIGNLVALHWNGSGWAWQDYGKPAGGNAQDVSAVTFRDYGATGTWIYAFVRAANNEIYARYGNGTPSAWSASLGKPTQGTAGPITVTTARQCVSGGCAADVTRAIHVWTVSNGSLWNLFWNGSSWTWGDLGKPVGTTLSAVKPSVVQWTELGQIRYGVFVLDTSGNLQELRWTQSGWGWNSHGKPAGVASLSAPSAVAFRNPQLPADSVGATTTGNARYVFVIGSDNKSYVRYTGDGVNWAWADQTTPYGNVPLYRPRGISALAYWSR